MSTRAGKGAGIGGELLPEVLHCDLLPTKTRPPMSERLEFAILSALWLIGFASMLLWLFG
jgi:hypothetical protein